MDGTTAAAEMTPLTFKNNKFIDEELDQNGLSLNGYHKRAVCMPLMVTALNTPEGEKLDILVTLIETYERKHFPLNLPDPVDVIKFEMEQKA